MPDHPVNAESNLRYRGFVESCAKYGLEERHIQIAPMSMEGGNAAARRIVEGGKPLPTALYFPLSPMAVAALPVFHHAGIRIPQVHPAYAFRKGKRTRTRRPPVSTGSKRMETRSPNIRLSRR